MKLLHSLLVCLLTAFAGCNHPSYDPRLTEIYGITSENPDKALSMLDSIDKSLLSSRDSHYYDFLTVKAADKAYITHTSDSLILDVIASYSERDPLYPELLYYVGRVNCDLGDFPTALSYFQQSLDMLPENDRSSELKRNLLSQIGRLFADLRLYDDALKYMEKTITFDKENKDTLGLALDLQSTAMIYLNTPHIDKAESFAEEALKWGQLISEEEVATAQMYLAAAKYKRGEYDSALNIIRELPNSLPPTCHNYVRSYLSDIYFKVGKLDSAYLVARDIIYFDRNDNKKNAYTLILSPEMREVVPADSVDKYQREFSQILEDYFDRYEAQQALIQNSYYNYRNHEKKRLEVEASRKYLILIISIVSTSLLFLIIILLILKNRNKSQKLRLHEALDKLNMIEESYKESSSYNTKIIETDKSDNPYASHQYKVAVEEDFNPDTLSIDILQERLKTKIVNILSDTQQAAKINLSIINSPICSKLHNLISEKKGIKDDSPLWKEIEDLISNKSKGFKRRLQILLGREVTKQEYKVAMLMKCGINPTGISCLLCKEPSSISYYRRNFRALKIDRSLDISIDDIIKIL